MPRKPRPRYDGRRKRWFANIGEPDAGGRATEVFAPPEIGERDEAAAWDWFGAERKRREARVVDPDNLDVEGVCELYLQHAEGLRDSDGITGQHYANKALHLGHLCGALGARTAKGLTPEAITGFLQGLPFSPNYRANIASTVSACFNWAARPGGLLPASPIRGFAAPVVPRAAERYAERSEAAAFLGLWRNRAGRGGARARFARLTMLMVRVMVHSGARPGELCNLWWSDVRWGAATTSAGHAYARAVIPSDRWKSGKKTGRSRTVYLTPTLTRALRRESEREGRHPRHVFVHGRGRGGKGAGEPWESGSRVSKTILRARRAAIAELADLARRRDEPGPWRPLTATERARSAVEIKDEGADRLVNYRWRHTAASSLLMLGVDVPTVAELLGTSPEMIYQNYGHLLDAHLAAAAEKLGAGARRRPAPR